MNASKLESMNATALIQWFENISTGKEAWYLSCCPQNIGKGKEDVSVSTDNSSVTWALFTKGWIYATAALVVATPNAFRSALPRTESWAVVAADKQKKELSQHLFAPGKLGKHGISILWSAILDNL